MDSFSIIIFLIIFIPLFIIMIMFSHKEANWFFNSDKLIKTLIREKVDKNIINIFILKDKDERIKPIYKERVLFDYMPGFNTSAEREYYVKVDYMENGVLKSLYIRIDYRLFKKARLITYIPE